jgi:hypothetical protein
LKTVQDLQSLVNIQGVENIAQVESLTEQAASDEKERVQEEIVNSQVNTMVDSQMNNENTAKIQELSSRLGIPAESADYKLGTKTEIAKVFLERAIKAGKSQDEIKTALTS